MLPTIHKLRSSKSNACCWCPMSSAAPSPTPRRPFSFVLSTSMLQCGTIHHTCGTCQGNRHCLPAPKFCRRGLFRSGCPNSCRPRPSILATAFGLALAFGVPDGKDFVPFSVLRLFLEMSDFADLHRVLFVAHRLCVVPNRRLSKWPEFNMRCLSGSTKHVAIMIAHLLASVRAWRPAPWSPRRTVPSRFSMRREMWSVSPLGGFNIVGLRRGRNDSMDEPPRRVAFVSMNRLL